MLENSILWQPNSLAKDYLSLCAGIKLVSSIARQKWIQFMMELINQKN